MVQVEMLIGCQELEMEQFDTGSNYARRQSDNGAADTTATSVTTWFEHFFC